MGYTCYWVHRIGPCYWVMDLSDFLNFPLTVAEEIINNLKVYKKKKKFGLPVWVPALSFISQKLCICGVTITLRSKMVKINTNTPKIQLLELVKKKLKKILKNVFSS